MNTKANYLFPKGINIKANYKVETEREIINLSNI